MASHSFRTTCICLRQQQSAWMMLFSTCYLLWSSSTTRGSNSLVSHSPTLFRSLIAWNLHALPHLQYKHLHPKSYRTTLKKWITARTRYRYLTIESTTVFYRIRATSASAPYILSISQSVSCCHFRFTSLLFIMDSLANELSGLIIWLCLIFWRSCASFCCRHLGSRVTSTHLSTLKCVLTS